jgi:hypothetical protein
MEESDTLKKGELESHHANQQIDVEYVRITVLSVLSALSALSVL